ncbi:reverse transcriptase domain-containing protein, partial [Tanacetum coccineum]
YETNRDNINGNNNGNGSHDSGGGGGRTPHTTRVCTYKEFLNCQPLNFKGTEGVVGLAYWFEKMESVFHISNCTVECQVKYATCTLLGGTWWISYVRTVGRDAAYGMPWKTLMKTTTENYCPRSDIKKLETELWNLVMKVMPKTLQEAIELANDLMDQKNRQNVARAYFVGPSKKKEYAGTSPLCNKCKFHHNSPCTVTCANCKRVDHLTRDCGSPTTANNQRTLTCFECGEQGHYHSECPKLKNQNRGNQAGSSEARGRVYDLGGGETDQDPNNIADDISA